MSTLGEAALNLCVAVSTTQSMPSVAARIAAWLVGAAAATGGFPIQVSYRQIQSGFSVGSVTVEGTGCHNATIRESLKYLEEQGLVKISKGAVGRGGNHLFSIEVR